MNTEFQPHVLEISVRSNPVPPPVKNGDILDVDEAAALLKGSKKTMYNRVKENTIPYAKLGRKLLFHRQSLIPWVADNGDRGKPYCLGRLWDVLGTLQS